MVNWNKKKITIIILILKMIIYLKLIKFYYKYENNMETNDNKNANK